MWGLDDLLNNVKTQDGQFSNIGNNMREAFSARVKVIKEYQKLINENIIYYAAHVLDPRIKFNLIDEQCNDPIRIRKEVHDYFKKEWLIAPLSKRSMPLGEIKAPKGAS